MLKTKNISAEARQQLKELTEALTKELGIESQSTGESTISEEDRETSAKLNAILNLLEAGEQESAGNIEEMEAEFMSEIMNEMGDREAAEEVDLFMIKTSELHREMFSEEAELSHYFDDDILPEELETQDSAQE